MKRFAFSLIILIVIFGVFQIAFKSKPKPVHESAKPNEKTFQITINPTPAEPKPKFALPVTEFKERITKKPFGIYITPENSPVKPERFSGYHTGVDIEYEGITEQVTVLAVCDGDIVLSQWVDGYGGTIVLKCQFENNAIYVLYGHLNPDGFTQNSHVNRGDRIGILGEGQTQATDFERKHLHLSVSKGQLDLRGYVNSKNELSQWHNPEEFLLP